MDRNSYVGLYCSEIYVVALRKESVDRNMISISITMEMKMSLSARRAWIEIHRGATLRLWACPVALRKESVDRNIWVIQN